MITLSREVYDTLVSHARRGRPEEVCGILAGDRDGGDVRVADTFLTENVAADPRTRYAIDPEEQLAVMEGIESRGTEGVGFYHSHPSGPDSPSDTDRSSATWPNYSYVIVSLNGSNPYVGSWRWTGDRFDPEAVVIGGEGESPSDG